MGKDSKKKTKIVTPHEFRTMGKMDILTGKNFTVINHYDHNEFVEQLPISLPDPIQARQICACLNKVFKLGIGWGYNYANFQKLTDDDAFVLTEDQVSFKSDLQNLETT